MNGKFLLDTNAVVALLGGDAGLVNLLQNAQWIGLPVIVELEFLSYPNLSASDQLLFSEFKKRVEVIGIDASDASPLQEIIRIRRSLNVKLPDAIISATAIKANAILLSNDVVFKRVSGLGLQAF